MHDATTLFIVVSVASIGLTCMFAFVYFANRGIGMHYDELAQRLAPILACEGVVFAEDGVRMRARWRAPLAIRIQWGEADVRVTPRALYLLQYRRLPFGLGRMGQPVLALVGPGAEVEPAVRAFVLTGTLARLPSHDGEAMVLDGTLGSQSFRIRLRLGSSAGFLAALDRRR